MKRTTLEALLAGKRQLDYRQQYTYITGLLEAGRIRASFGGVGVITFVMVTPYIEERNIAERHKKTQIFLRQIAAGNNEIDVFHPFRIIIVVEQFGFLIRKHHNF